MPIWCIVPAVVRITRRDLHACCSRWTCTGTTRMSLAIIFRSSDRDVNERCMVSLALAAWTYGISVTHSPQCLCMLRHVTSVVCVSFVVPGDLLHDVMEKHDACCCRISSACTHVTSRVNIVIKCTTKSNVAYKCLIGKYSSYIISKRHSNTAGAALSR